MPISLNQWFSRALLLGLVMMTACQQTEGSDPKRPDLKQPDPEEPAPSDCVAWVGADVQELVLTGMQVIQVIEVGDEIPIITGRPLLVRVKLHHSLGGEKPLQAPVDVNVHIAYGSGLSETVLAEGPECVPSAVDLDDINSTYNAVVPAELLVSDVEIHVTVSEQVGQDATFQNLRFPSNDAQVFTVVTPPPFRITFVPIIYNGIEPDLAGVTALDYIMDYTWPRFPLDEVDAVYREPLAVNGEEGETWAFATSAIIEELVTLRAADGSDRYYFGLLALEAFSPGGGRGRLGQPIAVGRERNLSGNRGGIVAHELGHNFGLMHVPLCDGTLTGSDPDYPHERGMTGVYGYDWSTNRLMLPTAGDIMSYCPPWWISDYHYAKILDFRAAEAALLSSDRKHLRDAVIETPTFQ